MTELVVSELAVPAPDPATPATPGPQVIRDPAELTRVLRAHAEEGVGEGRRVVVGFVPTMGYLHEGHATLIRQARQGCDVVVLSIFVNPLQFGQGEDLARYPRDLERDLNVAEGAGVAYVFTPDMATMYPEGFNTRVIVSGVSEPLDGASRPGHFTGVATVVLKLLNLVRPDRVFLGEKDWQQLAVLRRMVTDLNVPVEVVGVPTVREASGLAMSSRNSYLTDAQKDRAAVLSRALRAVQAAYAGGERRAARLRQAGLAVLAQEPEATLDYLGVVGDDLRDLDVVDNAARARVLLAARMFGVRLIDNLPLADQVTPAPEHG